jgi:hypothetical protein
MSNIQGNIQLLNQASGYNSLASNAAITNNVYQAQMSAETAALQARGTQAQLQLQQFTDAATINADLDLLGARQAQLLSSKGTELYLLVEQTREKLFNMFSQVIENKYSNSWNRIKSIANNIKY